MQDAVVQAFADDLALVVDTRCRLQDPAGAGGELRRQILDYAAALPDEKFHTPACRDSGRGSDFFSIALEKEFTLVHTVKSIVAGFLVVVVLSTATDFVLERIGILPTGALYDTGLLLLAVLYRSAYTVLGGFVAAAIAPKHQGTRNAVILGSIGAGVALVAALVTWNMNLGPGWYTLTLVATALPCAWYGGHLSARA